ncbi:hypothetical protein ACP70R_037230 [Stipagrostis hirtigluma subsp. patula]
MNVGEDDGFAKRRLARGPSSAPPSVLRENVAPPPEPRASSCGGGSSRAVVPARPSDPRAAGKENAAVVKEASRVPPQGGELKAFQGQPARGRPGRAPPRGDLGAVGEAQAAGDAEAAGTRPIKVFVRLCPMSREEEEEAGPRSSVEDVDGTDVFAKRRRGSFSTPQAVLTENVAPPLEPRASSCGGGSSRAFAPARPADPRGKENAAAVKKARRVPPLGGRGGVGSALNAVQAPAARRRTPPGSEPGAVGEVACAASDAGAAGTPPIKVFVRLRPMSREEVEAGSRSCVEIVDGTDVYLTDLAGGTGELRRKRVRGRRFRFDCVFPDSTTQAQVYRTS